MHRAVYNEQSQRTQKGQTSGDVTENTLDEVILCTYLHFKTRCLPYWTLPEICPCHAMFANNTTKLLRFNFVIHFRYSNFKGFALFCVSQRSNEGRIIK